MASCCWSSTLPNDLLADILSRLDLADHIRFGCVCKSWRSVTTTENPPTNKPLFLVRSEDPERLICRVLQTSFRRLLPLRTPKKSNILNKFLASFRRLLHLQTPGKSNILTIKIIGSFEGWLVIVVAELGQLFLFNSTRTADSPIPLPPPDVVENSHLFLFHKVVLSSPPSDNKCLIVLLMAGGSRLDFCRLGDTTWDTMNNDLFRWVTDIAFHKDRLYTVDWAGTVLAFDLGLNSKPTQVLQITLPVKSLSINLLVSVHQKLWVLAHNQVQVFEVDPMMDSGYVQVKSFRNMVLFASDVCSLVLSADDYPEFLPNHVYHISQGHDSSVVIASCLTPCVARSLLHPATGVLTSDYSVRSPVFFSLFRHSPLVFNL